MIFLLILFVFGLILLANWLAGEDGEQYRPLFDWLLVLINLGLLFLGGLIAIVPPDILRSLQAAGSPPINSVAFGLTLAGMALWGIIASIRPVRRILAVRLPLNAESPVHALALMLSGYLVGSTLLTLFQGGLEDLAATAAPAGLTDIVSQFFMFVFLALFGVGMFTRRNMAELANRLGLVSLTKRQLLIGVRWIALLVVLQWVFGLIGTALNPDQIELLDEISGSLLSQIDTVGEWLVLALATGVGEELLFRGAAQPALGLNFTAFLFAVAHVQYGITPITVAVFIIGVALGRLRRDHGTTLSMFVHIGYNFALGLMALLLQPLAG